MELENTVKSLRTKISDLKKIKLNQNPPAASGSEGHMNSNTGTSSLISTSDKEEENNLRMAYRDFGQRKMPEGTPMRTQYGYSLEYLTFVETVLPKLRIRQTTIESKGVYLSLLLMPLPFIVFITTISRKK